MKDLVLLLEAAQVQNRKQEVPCSKIQVGCTHIVRMLKLLNVEGNFEVQNKVVAHFCQLID